MNRQSGASARAMSADERQSREDVMNAVRTATPEQIQRLLDYLTYQE